jgi:hypothetical protein
MVGSGLNFIGTVSSRRAFRDRLAKANGERGPSHGGRRMHNHEVKMTIEPRHGTAASQERYGIRHKGS